MNREMTEAEFDPLVTHMLAGDPQHMDDDELLKRISVSQHVTDLLLNELERRSLLSFHYGVVMIPMFAPETRYVETVLTRP